MRYLLIDAANMLFRSRYATKGDAFLKSSLALHITFNSVRQAWRKFDADHVVFCFDASSWRKEYYPRYKANRIKIGSHHTSDEQEEDKIFFEVADKFEKFITEKTNCTVLRNARCEADDFIARWIQRNNSTIVDKANNHFTIVSNDSDFQQLIDTNVQIYDGVNQRIYSHKGIFNEDGNPTKDKKGVDLPVPDAEFILFNKCIRGDTSDNILSAYPGVRTTGTKSKVGIVEAFEDRFNKGYSWNNFFLQRWTDHYGEEHTVKECYEQNVQLIDLTKQPQEIKDLLDKVIDDATATNKKVPMVGAHFLKFCSLYDLRKMSDSPNSYIEFLNAPLHK